VDRGLTARVFWRRLSGCESGNRDGAETVEGEAVEAGAAVPDVGDVDLDRGTIRVVNTRAWTPPSTASAGPFLLPRGSHVTRRAMISRTQVRSARPPCVCTLRIRKWSSAG